MFRLIVRRITGGIVRQNRRRTNRDRRRIDSERRSSVTVVAQTTVVQTPASRPLDPHHPRVLQGKAWVEDGDTIKIGNTAIRLAGIDAPELDHPYGQKAKWAMHRLCKGQIITAEVTGEMSYNRVVAICRLPDGRDLAAELVKQGLAIDWPKYSGGRYAHLEVSDVRRRLWRCDARQKGRFPPNRR